MQLSGVAAEHLVAVTLFSATRDPVLAGMVGLITACRLADSAAGVPWVAAAHVLVWAFKLQCSSYLPVHFIANHRAFQVNHYFSCAAEWPPS